RRHTRSKRDWSSDVCSSDLSSSLALSSLEDSYLVEDLDLTFFFLPSFAMRHVWPTLGKRSPLVTAMLAASSSSEESLELSSESRSEERRVGKEWGAGEIREA